MVQELVASGNGVLCHGVGARVFAQQRFPCSTSGRVGARASHGGGALLGTLAARYRGL
jgi:hypothetical protein